MNGGLVTNWDFASKNSESEDINKGNLISSIIYIESINDLDKLNYVKEKIGSESDINIKSILFDTINVQEQKISKI